MAAGMASAAVEADEEDAAAGDDTAAAASSIAPLSFPIMADKVNNRRHVGAVVIVER